MGEEARTDSARCGCSSVCVDGGVMVGAWLFDQEYKVLQSRLVEGPA